MSKEARQQSRSKTERINNAYAEALEEASGEIKTIAAQVAETHHKTIHEVENALYLGPGYFSRGKHRTRSCVARIPMEEEGERRYAHTQCRTN